MAARIIPFPKLPTVKEGMYDATLPGQRITFAEMDAKGLHIVKPLIAAIMSDTQLTALRIVDDVCLEHDLLHPEFDTESTRGEKFWNSLPMPCTRVETPVSVAKRLAHMFLPKLEIA